MFGIHASVMKIIVEIRASYWFIPTTLVIAAIVLAALTRWIDATPGILPVTLPSALQNATPEGARGTLSVIAQSILGVAGVLFSVTMVAVSFASGQFGPRLIGNFMRDRGTQWSLGILISTFVYALLILRATDGGDVPFLPQLSMLTALGLTFLAVLTMIYFVHHIPETINVSNITADLGRRLHNAVKLEIDGQIAIAAGPKWAAVKPASAHVTLGQPGFIQQLDLDRLATLAEDHDWRLDIHVRPGDFVTTKTIIMDVYGHVSPDELTRLRQPFAIGPIRSEAQDIVVLVDQLVEMIARALSPGINDPFTAINCLNWLSVGLTEAATFNDGLRPVQRARLRYADIGFADLVDRALGQSWPYASTDDLAAAHWRHVLRDLADHTTGDNRAVLDTFLER
jgi:uncharacterized membrane protein